MFATPTSWAILPLTPACNERATALAQMLQLPILSITDARSDYILAVLPTHLEVQQKNTKPICVDFLTTAFLRRLHSMHAREPLLRAVGLKKNTPLNILDVTAGFGQDACMLAYHGAHVTLLERIPLMGVLLEDGLTRAQASIALKDTALRLQLRIMDARDYLIALTDDYPDVIYIDPMFVHTKSALPNKNMQFLHQIGADTPDADELLNLALQKASKRVVIKRAINAPVLAGRAPDMCIKSKLLRFDVFIQKS